METLLVPSNSLASLNFLLENSIEILGNWIYLIIFAIIMSETGFLIASPLLPGESLIFSVGALATENYINFWIAYLVLTIAAIMGNIISYWIGFFLGPKIFTRTNSRVLNKKYLEKAHFFYDKHGGKAILLARFIPIIRTFAPFIAGVGRMNYREFMIYSVLSAIAWVTLIISLGYFFGNLEIVRNNLEIALLFLALASIFIIIYKISTKMKSTINND